MKWQSLLDNTYSQLHPDQKVLIATRSGDMFLKAAHSPLPAGATHYIAIEAALKPWWEELPEEAVWFRLIVDDMGGAGGSTYTFARMNGVSWWQRLGSESTGTIQGFREAFPGARLASFR